MKKKCISILGVRVSAINMQMALAQMGAWLQGGQAQYVCVAPAHSLMACADDAQLRGVFNRAGMVTPDGMAVVWLLHLKGQRQVRRVYGPDLLLAACEFGLARGWRHAFAGGTPETLAKLAENLRARFPGLQVSGLASPPFRTLSDAEEQGLITQINAQPADILWVGLGSPRQELWMSRHLGEMRAPVMVGVGAAFDFLSGAKPQAPRWMQRAGLEWLFRLASEPRRLWPRYRQYPRFVVLALLEALGLKHFGAD